jgi:acetylornithine deacetylase
VTIENEKLARVPPLAPCRDGRAMQLVQDLGGESPTMAVPFGTGAGFFQDADIPAIVCGPGFIAQAHQPDEWIAIDQLEKASRLLDRVGAWASAETP